MANTNSNSNLGRKLNRLPQNRLLNRIHSDATAAGEAFVALLDAAEAAGVSILAVDGGPKELPSGTKQYIHNLKEVGTEDWQTLGFVFVRQVYHHTGGSVEVSSYFS